MTATSNSAYVNIRNLDTSQIMIMIKFVNYIINSSNISRLSSTSSNGNGGSSWRPSKVVVVVAINRTVKKGGEGPKCRRRDLVAEI